MTSKRPRQTGEVLAIRLPLELDRDLRAEARRLKVRPCDLARVALAVGWATNKAAGCLEKDGCGHDQTTNN